VLSHDAPAIVYVAVVFVLGSLRELPQVHVSNFDKLQHLLGFALMQIVVARAVAGRSHSSRVNQVVVAAAVASGLGALLELYQMALPWRSADLLDWVADSLGAALAAFASYWLVLRRERTRGVGESAPGVAAARGTDTV
jgi:VanZ family protein